ncbi:ABC transporter permease [Streptosporangium sp. NBC_01495]|uniref:ABC transporter permease n=1 Tax=Streptosporangium sp. NBC_01495 TaxID=2903899 RepID=UPI002E379B91|nr:ABC transporter permease [Streptosporangium sp. NBC_01495]
MLGYIRLEVTRARRDPGYVIVGFAMPVTMYLIFTNLGVAGDDRVWAALYVMVSMAAFGAIGSAFNNGSGIAEDRAAGWLRQLRITPLAPVRVIAGKAATGMLMVLPVIAGVCLAAALLNGVRMEAWQWISILLLLWVGSLPFTLLGLAFGYLFSGQTAAVLNISANMTMAIVGGLWLPTEGFPSWLRAIAEWTPSFGYADLSRKVAFGEAPEVGTALMMTGWLVAFGILAVYGYRRAGRVR